MSKAARCSRPQEKVKQADKPKVRWISTGRRRMPQPSLSLYRYQFGKPGETGETVGKRGQTDIYRGEPGGNRGETGGNRDRRTFIGFPSQWPKLALRI